MKDQEVIDLKNEDDFLLMEVVNEHDNRSEFTIVMPTPAEVSIPSTPKVLNYQASIIATPIRKAKKSVGNASKKFSIRK